jgi:hypothetical protein
MQMQMPACWLVGVVVGVLMLMLLMLPAREGPAGSCCSFLPWAAPSPPPTSPPACLLHVAQSARHGCRGHRGRRAGR